ncbi:1,2-dihydroxy-3,5-cyclohexadiene-1, 4-dicarboxylate dehydrogenase [Bradyrhizobium ivorense]|uniref:1,2-dihydroxy-3,5-cyclohexadiene-1, 4-dicarboxylate dehydrogenase n=1 Tax=Bradyrhizobium ivorense TaxID=2511166 RepID=A0A508T567_9BRAD|nr:4-hydroxythreonine-4-phosphate dehydrogenase PdxA [Bradyrhizobium ivorense]VIO68884.1 1,2-dihydroxy-3,5-cyclohexadiene-1, 4-dicarboxylate dehydrogenase [Bradyrhizobium ivorense]
MNQDSKTIALTIGDPNGIGPEIAVRAAAELHASNDIRIVLVGDAHVVRHYVERVGAGARLQHFTAAPAADGAILLHGVDALAASEFHPGQIEAAAGRATVAYVEAAIGLVRDGTVDAIVGCPHNETAVNAAGIPFSGYPGLIARLTGKPEEKVFMMLVGGGLRILHATLHERIHHALARLTPELIEEAGLACASTLQRLGVAHPRIGVFGINPHAGENGLFGDDDDHITAPAVARLRQAGIAAEGPVGADIMLGRKDIDGFVAIYHDQGHIPIKLLAGRNASALSVGAGVLFSSVGHGSAFDIAGQCKADHSAVLRTLRLIGNLPADKSTTQAGIA